MDGNCSAVTLLDTNLAPDKNTNFLLYEYILFIGKTTYGRKKILFKDEWFRVIHIGRNIPHLRLSFYFFFKVVNKSHKLVAGEIKSWWLGGLRSGPPSCVNQAVQTVMIKTSA